MIVLDARDHGIHGDVAPANDLTQLAAHAGRHQNAVQDTLRLLHRPEYRALLDPRAGFELRLRLEVPHAGAIERREAYATGHVIAVLLGLFPQWTLHAVEDAAEQTRPELHRQRIA
jgi:hypothetical protein